MYKRVLTLTFLLLQNTSISAIDLNETTVIIKEATEATQILQNEFNTLVNEIASPKKIEIFEINNSLPQVITQISPLESNETIKLKSNKNLVCKENNQSIMLHGLNVNLDENNSISDNGCTDSNLGTSKEGLIIFKTRIKPYCDISGETFAKQYMQEDWDDIYHEKEFKMEVIKACPKVERRYKDKWTPHLYQFTLEYASDSDAIPEC